MQEFIAARATAREDAFEFHRLAFQCRQVIENMVDCKGICHCRFLSLAMKGNQVRIEAPSKLYREYPVRGAATPDGISALSLFFRGVAISFVGCAKSERTELDGLGDKDDKTSWGNNRFIAYCTGLATMAGTDRKPKCFKFDGADEYVCD